MSTTAETSSATESRPTGLPVLVYDLNEVSEILKLSPVTVRRMIVAGKLRRVRGIRNIRIPVTELERWVRENSERL